MKLQLTVPHSRRELPCTINTEKEEPLSSFRWGTLYTRAQSMFLPYYLVGITVFKTDQGGYKCNAYDGTLLKAFLDGDFKDPATNKTPVKVTYLFLSCFDWLKKDGKPSTLFPISTPPSTSSFTVDRDLEDLCTSIFDGLDICADLQDPNQRSKLQNAQLVVAKEPSELEELNFSDLEKVKWLWCSAKLGCHQAKVDLAGEYLFGKHIATNARKAEELFLSVARGETTQIEPTVLPQMQHLKVTEQPPAKPVTLVDVVNRLEDMRRPRSLSLPSKDLNAWVEKTERKENVSGTRPTKSQDRSSSSSDQEVIRNPLPADPSEDNIFSLKRGGTNHRRERSVTVQLQIQHDEVPPHGSPEKEVHATKERKMRPRANTVDEPSLLRTIREAADDTPSMLMADQSAFLQEAQQFAKNQGQSQNPSRDRRFQILPTAVISRFRQFVERISIR